MDATEIEIKAKLERFLVLGSCEGLEEIKKFVIEIFTSIQRDPTSLEARKFLSSSLTKRPSELEALKYFLKKIAGFVCEENHGVNLENVWILPLPPNNLHAQLSKLRNDMDWLKNTLEHLIQVAKKYQRLQGARIAETTVRLSLPTTRKVEGGFLRETLEDVLKFARLFFEPQKRHLVQLRQTHVAQPLTQGGMTLAELKFGSGVILMVSLLDEHAKEKALQQSHTEEDPERLKRKKAAIQHQKEVKEKQEKHAAFRQKQIDEFHENQQRNNPKRRRLSKETGKRPTTK